MTRAQVFEKLTDHPEDIDLIISDIDMPEMNGYQFIRRLRYGAIPRYKDVPAIVLTGNDTKKNLQSAQILKISSFFVKPASKVVLEKTIRRILKTAYDFSCANHASLEAARI